ncbi:MAG: hypothetical protein J5601_06740 [Elusimicrobiaceae bacterium]|nr:hypothetical protein [Elusimicrobiaceae bacterium]
MKSLELDCEIGLKVTDVTAAACCGLLGVYFSNNPDKHLGCKTEVADDGERKIRFFIQEEEDGEKE